jgi:hypothetical protein
MFEYLIVFIVLRRRSKSDVINLARLKSCQMNGRLAVQSNYGATVILKSFASTILFQILVNISNTKVIFWFRL